MPVFSAEHLDPQSTHEQKANDYGNVVYACSFCNNARRRKPRVTPEGRLLDPTEVAWAEHFEIQENYLVPKENDADAIYTHQAYNLDDERKVSRRTIRYEILSSVLEIIQEGLPFLDELIDGPGQEVDQSKLEKHRRMRVAVSKASKIIKLYAPVPHDAPTQCRCETADMHSLPEEFAKQIITISSFL